jgi:hypothetical protein
LLGETVQIPVVASEKSVEKDGTNARLIVEAVRPRFRIECSVETTQVLLDEFLPLDIQLMNDEPFTVRALLDISIRSDLVATQSLDEHQSTPIAAADTLVAIGVPDELSAINRLNLGEIASQSSVHKQLFLRCKKQPGHRTIHITAHFGKVISGSSEPITPSSVSKELKLHAVNPLEHSFEIVRSDRYPSATTQKYHSATQGLAISHQPFLAAPDEPFTHQTDYTVMVSVKNCSPFDLNLLRYGYEPLALVCFC